MPITVDPDLENRLRERAQAEGLTVSAYVEGLLREEDAEIAHTEALLEEAAGSGDYVELTELEWDGLERESLTEAETRATRRG